MKFFKKARTFIQGATIGSVDEYLATLSEAGFAAPLFIPVLPVLAIVNFCSTGMDAVSAA